MSEESSVLSGPQLFTSEFYGQFLNATTDWSGDAAWSNLAKVVFKRTYPRPLIVRSDAGHGNATPRLESFPNLVERVIRGNVQKAGSKYLFNNEVEMLARFMLERKALPAGRGLWASGSAVHQKLGGAALSNCWFTTSSDWQNFVMAMDLLMLGGGVGMSIEHRYTSHLPRIKKDVKILHKDTKDADYIVPDSREGWCHLIRKLLYSYFVAGRSFSYSTVCVRGFGEIIQGFGGVASGPIPLINCVEKIQAILRAREGRHVRPVDAMDILCCIGELIVSGNVRRSALLILGDSWDKEFLRSKRWDLGPIPTQRAMANLSIVIDDPDDFHPLYWKTFENGEPFGVFNRKNSQTFGRMGEKKKDTGIGANPCVPAGTEILTKHGYQVIEDIVGQKIEVWNGFEWSEVIPKITGYEQSLVMVSLSSGQSLTCTEAHKFVISTDYFGNEERISAINLEPGMKLIKCEYPVLSAGTNVPYAYTQGFISGDGMNGYSHMLLYGEKIQCSSRMQGTLSKSGTEERRSFRFNFDPHPKEFVPFFWDIKSRLDWLAGLIDADGCELREGGSQICSVNHSFLTSVQKMLTTMGVSSKVTRMSLAGKKPLPDGHGGSRLYDCQTSYRILIGAAQIQFLKNIGLRCERLTFDKSPNRDATRFVTVTDVQSAGIAPVVYCFTEPKRNLGCFEGIVTGQCAEAILEDGEPCNLQDLFLPNIKTVEELILGARLMHRYGKRVTLENYHNPKNDEVIKRNRRIGTGITGCLQSPLFNPKDLDAAYRAIQEENVAYSKQLGIPESIRTTVVKPSGTLSIVGDCTPGIHPSYSRHYIRRVRFSSNDKLIPILREAGHPIEPVMKFDGTLDHGTLIADFYCRTPEKTPCADEGFDTWKQLEAVLMAQRHWADQSVSCTVYYNRAEISKIKEWLNDNLKNIKTISFLCHSDHGFKQAPLEAISQEQFEKSTSKIKAINEGSIGEGDLESVECSSGACPIR